MELGVTWANMPLLPGALKELALKKAFEALPGEYAGGLLRLNVAELRDSLPVNFVLSEIEINQHGIWIMLHDVAVYPLELGGLVTAEPHALVPVPSTEEAQLPEHQSYYQRLREWMHRLAAHKAPKWAQPLVPWILAAPDFFVLLVRLARDERVPAIAKVIAGTAIAYFISPVDLIPDLLPLVGHVDDLTLAIFAVEQVTRRIPAEVVQEHWPGSGRVADLLRDGSELFSKVLPAKVLVALKRVLSAR